MDYLGSENFSMPKVLLCTESSWERSSSNPVGITLLPSSTVFGCNHPMTIWNQLSRMSAINSMHPSPCRRFANSYQLSVKNIQTYSKERDHKNFKSPDHCCSLPCTCQHLATIAKSITNGVREGSTPSKYKSCLPSAYNVLCNLTA